MPVKKSVLPTINKSGKEKREIDELCKHAEKLHGGKLVPIVDKETSPEYKKTANQPQAHVVKKYRIVEQVYVLNGPQKEEQLMISYLQRRPQTSKPKPTPKKANEKVIDITFNQKESGKFHGVIRYLTQKCGGNVHHTEVVNVTSSSIINENQDTEEYPDPYHSVELDNVSSSFASDYEENAWLCYDFKERRVKPSAYSIRTYIYGPNHLISWCIECSNDQENWEVIDEQNSSKLFDNIGKSITFQIKSSVNVDYYRFIRIRLTGPTVTGKYILNISALEYFGSLLGSDPIPVKQENKKKIQLHKLSVPHSSSPRRTNH
ncbi:hypothetical protein M9Y10_007226 [Tritrichomonas musculus]|uniref:F5/8 type C domain-containing protein n=1 Tax=Tritrichomonas musculus TaxID=1915356 RepID=A0ABR2J0Q9_9EUKA